MKRKIRKFIIAVSSVLIGLLVLLIVSINIYVGSHAVKIRKKDIASYISVELSEDQAKLIWFFLTGDKTFRFHSLPVPLDIFFTPASCRVSDLAAQYIISDRKYSQLEWPLVLYATSRHIADNMQWKICIEFIMSNAYLGKANCIGLNNASREYYGKIISKLSQKELLRILLLLLSPTKYKIGANEQKAAEKIVTILTEYKNN